MHETLADQDDHRNHVATSHRPLMPFGKHKGTPLEELPSEYLLWLGCLDLRQPLIGHVLREMGRRLAESEGQP